MLLPLHRKLYGCFHSFLLLRKKIFCLKPQVLHGAKTARATQKNQKEKSKTKLTFIVFGIKFLNSPAILELTV